MLTQPFKQLYQSHRGKVSDKWTLYISEYEALLRPYRDREIAIFEIGVQNGGSLEIYGQYFQQARAIVGCDIDEQCSVLEYDNSCISIVIGDANAAETKQRVLSLSPTFDIIIDDGSHQSRDIISSFVTYFKHLNVHGTYVVEDLHCSYWKDYGGGLFASASANSFFKLIADVINQEHWGLEKRRIDLLDSFFKQHDIELGDLDETDLAHIHSVKFVNSMCIIEKRDPTANELGSQWIAGEHELVWEGRKALHGKPNAAPVQESLFLSQDVSVELLLSRQQADISLLKENLAKESLRASEAEQRLCSLSIEKDVLNAEIAQLIQSTSWKVTAPLRSVYRSFSLIQSSFKGDRP